MNKNKIMNSKKGMMNKNKKKKNRKKGKIILEVLIIFRMINLVHNNNHQISKNQTVISKILDKDGAPSMLNKKKNNNKILIILSLNQDKTPLEVLKIGASEEPTAATK